MMSYHIIKRIGGNSTPLLVRLMMNGSLLFERGPPIVQKPRPIE